MEQERVEGFPCSPQQKRLWLLGQGGGRLLAARASIEIRGQLDPARLKAAVERVVARYEIFRTRFIRLPHLSLPVQVVTECGVRWHDDVVLGNGKPASPAGAAQVAELFFGTPSEEVPATESGAVVAAQVIRVADEEHLLLVRMPALCADSATMELLVGEIARAYDGASSAPVEDGEEQPLQYADLAQWQNELLESEENASERQHWASLPLADAAEIHLAYEQAAPPGAPFEQAHLELAVDDAQACALREFATQCDSPLRDVWLAAWSIVLARHAGRSQLPIATACDGRTYEELAAALGPLARMLPCLYEVDESASFGDAVRRTGERVETAYQRQEYFSWDRLAGEEPPPLPFAFERTPARKAHGSGAQRFSLRDCHVAGERFLLKLELLETGGSPRAVIHYDAIRFAPRDVASLGEQLLALLDSAAQSPQAPLRKLTMASSAERRRLLVELNATAAVFPRDICYHEVFQRRAAQTPAAAAVICEGAQLTYAQLSARANQLANLLRTQGVGPDVAVAICLPRSIDAVVAILGVLKAGGAYVPLDPSYPTDRLHYMLADCAAPVLLTHAALVERLAPFAGETLCLDRDARAIEAQPAAAPAQLAQPENLAYIIYTSGSTGRPKGAMITHRGLMNYLTWAIEEYAIAGGSGVPVHSSLSFDLTVTSLLAPLVAGVPTLMLREEQGIGMLEEALRAGENFSLVKLTPAHLDALNQRLTIAELAGRTRAFIIGGEALKAESLAAWRQHAPQTRLINEYGPTETVVGCCIHEVAPADSHVGSVSIGHPIANTQLYVLDAGFEPTPFGVAGELYIGGEGVARGYLKRPDLTAERFVPDPFSRAAGARLYRTGDLCRWRPDGTIDFLGRLDHQVKIRGYRIELGEIESVLLEQPTVRDAAVLAREDHPGVKRLVGYLVAEEGAALDTDSIRAELAVKLPDYMVPAALVVLDALPLTANGKLNRDALPAPESVAGKRTALVPPRTLEEKQLAEIWCRVLGLEEIGVTDNFFELGGDSILAIQVISKANQQGLKLSPQQMFHHQTVAELAAVAGEGIGVDAEQGLVEGPAPLTPAQHWFFDRQWSSPAHYNQSVLLQLHQPMDSRLLEQAVRAILAHHDALRMRFTREGNAWRQANVAAESATVFERIDLSALPADQRQAAIQRAAGEAQRNLDLADGPLVRVLHFVTGEPAQRLLLAIHHLVVDGVSWRILLEDLLTGYALLERGAVLQLPPKTTSFRAWAERLAQFAASDQSLEDEASWWANLLAGASGAVPVDHSSGDNSFDSTEAVELALDEDETQALLQGVPHVYRTRITDLLLAALAQTLSQWTGREESLVTLEGHGREPLFDDVDLSRTVGWFTSIYPVRLQWSPGAYPGLAIKAVKEQLRRIPRAGIGYGLLRYLRGHAELASADPQVSFNYLGQFSQALPDGLPISAAPESTGATQDPLSLRAHLLDIVGGVDEGRLKLRFTFSRNRHQRATIERLAAAYAAALRMLIDHCRAPEAGGCTPSDFPLAQLDQSTVDRLCGDGRAIDDLYPLSPLQAGLLFHTLFEPEAAMYNEQTACRFLGPIDPALFRQAWQQAVDRHPILRTSFAWDGLREPLQVVHHRAELPFALLDWRDLPPEESAARMEQFLIDDQSAKFDVARAPLMRVALIRLADETWQFVWNHHHLVLDGWSVPLLLKDVMLGYDALVRGAEFIPEPSRPYRDYITWLRAQDPTAAEAFWRNFLRGYRAPTPLIVERTAGRQELPAEQYARGEIRLPAAASAALEQFARKNRLTPNTVVQGAWAILLSRYSGEQEVLYGATVAGRSAPLVGIETMFGMFINTLPMHAQVDPQAPLLPWFEALQRDQAELRQHEATPLVEVQGWSEIPRGLPLFESLIVFENYPIDSSLRDARSNLAIADVRVQSRTNYPLTWIIAPGEQLTLSVLYDQHRFDSAAIDRMLGHFAALLEAIPDDPRRALADLPLLTAAEQTALPREWNDTAVDYPRDTPVDALFESQVERTPRAVAVTFGDQQLTYVELNAAANQLAHHLRELGAGPDVLVAICLERSIDMVVALLGVLKAGSAYIPLDPDFPPDRLAMMLEDGQPPIVVTQQSLAGTLPTGAAQVVLIDAQWPVIGKRRSANPKRVHSTGHLAYAIYTSGSTGRPKGVQIPHRALTNFLLSMQREPGLTASDVLLAVTTLSFDIAGLEMYLPLITGARLAIVDRETASDGERLHEAIDQTGATALQATPVTWRLLLQAGWRPSAKLKMLIGGEALPRDLARALLDNTGVEGGELWNMYGPTETTIWSTTIRIAPDFDTITIGRPIANTQVHILDARYQPAPVGVAGELHIGGDGVARGYHERRELSADRFVPDPFSGQPGARMYKTGDLCRWLPDGTIEFLGRIDHQVKIRGFRIELGDIENALGEHPAVREAVVVAREDEPGQKRLVAYVVPESAAPIATTDQAEVAESYVDQWQTLWTDTYEQQASDDTFNIAGWNSSYTGEPIPADQMRLWRDETVARIRALQPRRLMEIGCGEGLLLLEVAPSCQRYHGVDFSPACLAHVRRKADAAGIAGVTLEQRSAENFAGIEPGAFDTFVINSVIQYFPSAEYLTQVLEQAVAAVGQRGRIFIGDVRSLELLEAFHASVVVHQAPELGGEELAARLRQHLANEKELLVSREFFAALQQRLPQITRVEMQLKRGGYDNELSRFRYDVVLHVGPVEGQAVPAVECDWNGALSLEALGNRLRGKQPAALVVRGVPNRRTAAYAALAEQIVAGTLRVPSAEGELTPPFDSAAYLDPNDFWALGDALGYNVDVTWSNAYRSGAFDAIFYRPGCRPSLPAPAPHSARHAPPTALANQPLAAVTTERLVPTLRASLVEKLPDYMVPSAIVLLDALPLTPNGKIDRKRLPAPAGLRPELASRYAPPRTPTEEALARLWAEVLGVDRVGIEDNFFELGGHSLLATQLVSRVRQTLGAQLPLRKLFELPTVAALARTLDAEQSGRVLPPITPMERAGELPLSFAQQRLWFLTQLVPDSALFNMPAAVQLDGDLDLGAFRRSLQEIVRRHESLRTTFTSRGGAAVQSIAPALELNIPLVELGDLPAEQREAEVLRRAREFARTPFDLEAGPLLRISLLRLARRKHVLLVVMHHIISDGWSLGVMVQEFAALYAAFTQNLPSPLAALPLQYADFAAWQRAHLAGVFDEQLAYWKQQLAAPPALDLATDKPRPALRRDAGGQVPITLPRATADLVRQVSEANRATPFMTLLAAFQALLGRLTGQDDLIVGTNVAGRNQPEVENLIGFFINNLALRADLSGDPSFSELLARVRETALTGYANQDVPFERVVEQVQLDRDTSREPLYQAVFVLQNIPLPDLKLPSGLALAPLNVGTGTAKNDLVLTIWEQDGALAGTMEYSSDLFEPATIERMVGQFQTLLDDALRHPQRRLSQLELLAPAERRTLLDEWNDTATALPGSPCIHQRIEEQVRRTPDSVAVVCGNESLTYAELNARANRLAHLLRKRGAAPDRPVAICLPRSIDLVAAIIAVQKAGGGYVPVDPEYPADRQAFMLADSGAPVAITTRAVAAQLAPPAGTVLLVLDDLARELAAQPATDPPCAVGGDNLAYVLYTSGSTGRPKGAMISHRAICNHMDWIIGEFGLTAADRVIQKTPFSFDASVWEFYAPLLVGGALVVARPGGHSEPDYLAATIVEQGVTVLQVVPSLLRLLVETPAFRECTSLRHVFSGGEALTAELRDQVRAALPQAELTNLYGPTECTIDTVFHRCGPSDRAAIVPIGRPVANTRLYIVDPNFSPAPIGVPGELCIGGTQLGRGYWGRPELTAERFEPDPFGEAGARLYRTGDRCRYLPDGTIEFLGRIDRQVKLRGFRIELGEIEAALKRDSSVRQAIVIVHRAAEGDERLVAYVERTPGGSVDVARLRASLAESLPEYMVPSSLMVLDAFPLTPNGKLDRRALPAPDGARPELAGDFAPPQTDLEKRLAGLWSELLRVERVGIHDNFFDLGGHSLLATQLASRVRESLAVELPLRDLFANPTIASLAAVIEQGAAGAAGPPLARAERTGPLPLSFAQERLWFLDQLVPGGVFYNLPVAVRLTGPLNRPAFEQSLNEIVRRHEALRTTFAAEGGQASQVIAPELQLVVPLIDLTANPASADPQRRENEVRRLVQEEALRPFSLERGPLVRASLIRLAPTEHVAVLVLHHIIADGWSLGILAREIGLLYDAFARGAASPLPELAVQYADFAAWQKEWLASEALEKQLGWWREELAELPVLELPTDRPRPAVQTFRGAKHEIAIESELAAGLQALGDAHGATLFMTLLAGFQALLARYSGQQEVVVGSAIAGRNRSEIEGLIGFFVNNLVLRADLAGNPRFSDFLTQVRDRALAAFENQDVPYEKLVQELHPQRDLSREPLFQVMFALQNLPLGDQRLPSGLTLAPVPLESDVAKFDLSLIVSEDAGRLRLNFEYNTDLFDAATIARLADHYARLLAGAVTGPRRRISELPLLSDAERAQLLVAWNSTDRKYPRETCAHELFERHASRDPKALAVSHGQRSLNYGDLNARANQLAHRLRELGVGPDVLVGVCVPRSIEMVVGILGVLKAGGAYLPLDPEHPAERLAFMLADAQASVLLTTSDLAARLGGLRAELLCLDDWTSFAALPAKNPKLNATSDCLAYVIYTSGSTGLPKGVEISHAGLGNLIAWHQYEYGIAPTDRATQIASFAFDASVWELWPYLTAGASIILPEEAARSAPAEMVDWLVRERITISFLPTPLAEAALEQSWPENVRLRALLTGGDRLRTGKPDHLPFDLVNHYGPTENSVVATFGPVAARSQLSGLPPIGRAIDNVQVYLLDQHQNLAPIGGRGELYIGGASLARGYLRRPELTAERFIPNPFSAQPGERLYRTGDVARWRADGQIEFLGRADHQVKVRGYRIELGEIEAALLALPKVQEAAVLAIEQAGAARLVGYIVPAADVALSPDAIREALQARLPEYMVPMALVPLARLPLTPNGKLDRRALPHPELGDEYVAPRTPLEEQLAAVWSQVLAAERVGVHDNFFELGGHSLLATQLVSRVRETCHVELPLRELFANPTVAALATVIEAGTIAAAGLPLAPVDRSGPLPLSFAQERLWFLDQLTPGGVLYNIPVAVRLTGPLDRPAFERSLKEIVRRHEALRTTFGAAEGRPIQLIAPQLHLEIPLVDLSVGPLRENRELLEAEVRRLLRDEALRPMQLDCGPLIRALLVRLAPEGDTEEHVVVLVLHHIIADGWSMGVLARELGLLYDAFSRGLPSPLPELPIQYADFAAWQKAWLGSDELQKQLNWWRDELAELPVLELPADRPRPAVQTFRGGRHAIELSKELTAGLHALGDAHGATLFMTLLAGFQALLARYSGQQEVVVGSAIAGRNRGEIEGLIGFFINNLVMRADLAGDPRFSDFLAQIRDRALAAFENQDVPYEKLVQELHPQRDLSREPLFQVMFALQNLPLTPQLLPSGLTLAPLPLESDVAKFDLALVASEAAGRIHLSFEFTTDLFDHATIVRLANHYERLLTGAVAEPQRRISALPLLSAPEREQMLVAWNATDRDYPRAVCAHELFERHAALNPKALAVSQAHRSLTYGQLNARANQLAHRLRELGVGADALVGVCVPRSIEMVVGVLGILKAGGAYLPLDPEHPAERLAFMLGDAQAAVLLTTSDLAPELRGLGGELLCLDLWDEFAALPDENPRLQITSDHLAYVIYTSGSTGLPKGVEISHAALGNLIAWHQHEYNLTPADRATQVASFAFDASVWELWPYLTAGASIILPDDETRSSPAELVDWLDREQITISFLPTPLAEAALEQSWPEQGALRALLTGGDRLRTGKPDYLSFNLVNHYGPTENAVVATFGPVADRSELAGLPPIGRGIDNVQVYLLDRHFNPAPIGGRGELYIGGASLARGYLRRPDLTAERFVPNPFSADPGARLYRTGDVARWRADGQIEFLGRADHQVKVRGYRIELGEIEAALLALPEVKEALVLAIEQAGAARLIGYVVPEAGADFAVEPIREALLTHLPDYMVPSQLIRLEQLPLTPNGKLDRLALPHPDAADAYAPPRNPLEERLAEIWSEVLGRERVGIHDNFFELGGHSLAIVEVIHAAGRHGMALSPQDMLQSQTIAELSAQLGSVEGTATIAPSCLVPLQPAGTRTPLFCIHQAQGMVFSYLPLAEQLGEDQPVYGLQARGLNGAEAPLDRLEEMAAQYIEAIRTVQPFGPYRLLGHSLGGYIAYEMARQLDEQGESVELLAIVDTIAPSFHGNLLRDALAAEKDESEYLAFIAATVERFGGVRLGVDAAELTPLPSDERYRLFLDKVAAARDMAERKAAFGLPVEGDGMPAEALLSMLLAGGEAALRGSLAVTRAGANALRNYVPGNYAGRITLLRAAEAPAELRRAMMQDPSLGWDALAASGTAVEVVPGDVGSSRVDLQACKLEYSIVSPK